MPFNFLCTQPCHLQTVLFLPSRVYGSYLLSLHHHSGWNFQYNVEWGGVSGHPHFVLDCSLSTKHGANCMVLLVDVLWGSFFYSYFSVSFFLKINWCLILPNSFYASINVIVGFLFFSWLYVGPHWLVFKHWTIYPWTHIHGITPLGYGV